MEKTNNKAEFIHDFGNSVLNLTEEQIDNVLKIAYNNILEMSIYKVYKDYEFGEVATACYMVRNIENEDERLLAIIIGKKHQELESQKFSQRLFLSKCVAMIKYVSDNKLPESPDYSSSCKIIETEEKFSLDISEEDHKDYVDYIKEMSDLSPIFNNTSLPISARINDTIKIARSVADTREKNMVGNLMIASIILEIMEKNRKNK